MFDVVTATSHEPVDTGDALVFPYPAGTVAADFTSDGHKASSRGLMASLSLDDGDFTLSFGASFVNMTYFGTTSIPSGTVVRLELHRWPTTFSSTLPGWVGYTLDTKARLEAANVPSVVDTVVLLGYSSAGDGGGARYKRVDAEPSHEGKIQSDDGAWWEIAEATYDVKQFGAKGDGSTDDTTAVQAALDAAEATGTGNVHFPAGTYLVETTLTLHSAVHVAGDGRSATTLKWTGGVNHLVGATNISDFSFGRMTLDGDRDSTSIVHCFRGAGIDDFLLYDLLVQNATQYGIGLQAGTIQNGVIRDTIIRNVGTDGIDFKNPNSDNRGLRLSNIVVEDFGSASTTAAGVDIRGIATLTGIHVRSSMSNTQSGIRFRETVTPTGAKYSSLSGFYVENTGASRGGFLVAVNDQFCRISTGTVKFGFAGVVTGVDSADCGVANVAAEDCERGFSLRGNRAAIDSTCHAFGCGRSYYVESGNNNKINGATSQGATTAGFEVKAGAVDSEINNPTSVSDAATISDNGTNTAYDAEGSITPTVSFQTAGDLSVAYSIQTGRWWRKGLRVWYEYRVKFTPTYTTASGIVLFNGLPFTSRSITDVKYGGYVSHMSMVDWQTSDQMLTPSISGGESRFSLQRARDAATNISATEILFPSGTEFDVAVAGSYLV